VLIAAVVLVGDLGVVTRALELGLELGLELELSTSLVLQQENKKQPMAKEWNWFVCCVCFVLVGMLVLCHSSDFDSGDSSLHERRNKVLMPFLTMQS
jgi:hypothetical protein